MNFRTDDYSFEQTAQAVYFMNESAQELYEDWHSLEEAMVGFAYQYAADGSTTSFSTGGFHLSFSRKDDGVYIVASVQAYTALRYAEAVTNRLDTIRALLF